MNIVDTDWVNDYIENEKEYIKSCMEEDKQNIEGYKNDLDYLENLTEQDIEEISYKVSYDDELENKINDLIHYYLYH